MGVYTLREPQHRVDFFMDTQIQLTNEKDIVYSSFKLHKNGLSAIGTPTFEQWEDCGKFIRKAEGAVHFWIGDWLNYGEAHYGETYTQAIDATNYDYQTIANDKWLSNKIQLSLRKETISNNHYQTIASLPEKEKEYWVDELVKDLIPVRELKQKIRQRNKEIAASLVTTTSTSEDVKIIHGDFRNVPLDENSIDIIITDPPYPSEFLPLWTDLAVYANKVLKPSGLLIAYSGELHLKECMDALSSQLQYYWTMALFHEGATQLVMARNMMCGWKPLIIYQKAPFHKLDHVVSDRIQSVKPEKSLHEWQQSESGVKEIIERFTDPGDMILDPFSGSGTTIAVAKELGRKAIGIEINETDYKLSLSRI